MVVAEGNPTPFQTALRYYFCDTITGAVLYCTDLFYSLQFRADCYGGIGGYNSILVYDTRIINGSYTSETGMFPTRLIPKTPDLYPDYYIDLRAGYRCAEQSTSTYKEIARCVSSNWSTANRVAIEATYTGIGTPYKELYIRDVTINSPFNQIYSTKIRSDSPNYFEPYCFTLVSNVNIVEVKEPRYLFIGSLANKLLSNSTYTSKDAMYAVSEDLTIVNPICALPKPKYKNKWQIIYHLQSDGVFFTDTNDLWYGKLQRDSRGILIGINQPVKSCTLSVPENTIYGITINQI
jgi:hypothetical protein